MQIDSITGIIIITTSIMVLVALQRMNYARWLKRKVEEAEAEDERVQAEKSD